MIGVSRGRLAFLILALAAALAGAQPRQMENLGRGLVAFRDGNSVYMSWRLLATDPDDVRFEVYRSTDGGPELRVNHYSIFTSTNFVDTAVDLTKQNVYTVRPRISTTWLKPSKPVTLPANPPTFIEQAHLLLPLAPLPDHYVHLAWVGDLDGDGEYDFVVDRIPSVDGISEKLEAYLADGTFLWRMDMGPGSLNRDNLEPGPTAISTGHQDGVEVYDMDGDGRAEVMVRSGPGVTFGDGATWSGSTTDVQFISVVDGMTGAELSHALVPNEFIDMGPVSGHFGIGYLDGVHPSLLYSAENRIGGAGTGFNRIELAYDYSNRLRLRWQWDVDVPVDKFHQIRIGDVDRDGKDELLDGGFVVDDDGTLLYRVPGICHGDRFHVGDLDPARPGLEGYGVLQDHPDGLVEYYYDAATGEMLGGNSIAGVVDNGRGVAADVDPNHEGYEYWSFYGMYNAQDGEELAGGATVPWPNFRIWWDGDVGSENLDATKVEKWNADSKTISRLLTGYREGATESWRNAPAFYGDILGDWREEIMYEVWDHSAMIIFVTTDVTDTRLYTLAHNPMYRCDMTTRGYYQSNMVDYYLGFGMAAPPRPDIFVLPLVMGDADGDLLVTTDDLTSVEDNFGHTGPEGGSLLGDANGDGVVDGQDAWLVRSLVTDACNAADFAEPFNTLDPDDVLAYLSAFSDDMGRADVGPDWAELDFFDVLAFLASFDAGCP
ncbi:MAG: hypothetical protein H6810_02370 [Phycisphaeraceae bacterium]|nr:MAG: hypothetical protein H6810_02370 [Phycisphaeraceae bacterium]